jgi:hypothetical protein
MLQKSGDHWRPLGFLSCKLTDTESCYSTFNHELLAAQAAVKHFRHFCEGRVFQLWTNHNPCYCPVTCLSPHVAQTAAPFGFYLRVQCTAFVSPRFEKCRCRFIIPPAPTVHFNSHRHSGSRFIGFGRDGRRAKPLRRNSAFSGLHIP